jgi:predicted ester cyclase
MEEIEMTSNADTISRMFHEVINEGHLERIDDFFAPTFTSHTGQGDMDREGFSGFVRAWRGGFPDIVCDVSGVIEEGDRIAWTVRARGTHKGEFIGISATGRTIDFLSLNQAIMRDGRAVEHWVVMDTGTMLAQLGVTPAAAGAGA